MRTIAVLIDAENVQASFGDKVFSYANSLGNVIVKEIYGVASALGLWVEPVLKYAIHPNLTIKASKFKNTSDISLVIGAMDPKAGACGSVFNIPQEERLNHRVEIETGVMEEECSGILKGFFRGLRQDRNRNKSEERQE